MSGPFRRRAVPTVLQQEAVECGAACLAMVLAHHGRWIALEELREACDVGRDGTKASNVIKVARRLGMVAKGLKRDLADLSGVPSPFIVFWNFNHFVVVEGLDLERADGRVWINDPGSGPRTVTRKEFDEAFTGVVLAFEPGPDFRREGRRDGLGAILARLTAGYRRPIAVALVAGALLMVPSIVAASFSRIFIDSVLIGGHLDWLQPLLAAMAVVAILRGCLSYLQSSILNRTQVAIATATAARQMWRVLHLPLGFFSQRYAGDIANRFTLVDQVAGLITGTLAPSAISIVSILGYGVVLLLLDPVLGAVSATAAIAALTTLWLSARGIENASRRSVSDQSRLQAMTLSGISLAEDVRASGTESRLLGRWSGAQARVVDAEQDSQLRGVLLSFLSSLAIALGSIGILVVGGFRVMDGAISIGVLLAFQMLETSFLGPVQTLVGVGGQIQHLRGLSERLDDVERYRTVGAPGARATPAARLSGPVIHLRDVAFGYQQLEAPFISGLELSIGAATRVAIVGGSGSGKSTIGRMIVGLLAPTGGAVELHGIPLPDWPEPDLRRRIAYVDQNVSLLEGSVRDNVTLWDDTLPEERVVAAAHDACAHGFITSRPGAYGTRLSEGGGNLSGGERQRLAIARALAVDPSVLVLDEATSALDSITEAAVMDAIRRKGCACVIIAHRLSTIRDCDVIVVVRAGRISETGTHAELMSRDGEYRHLVEH